MNGPPMPEDLRALLTVAREAASAESALSRAWPALKRPEGPVRTLAIGKASARMATKAAELLGPRLQSGLVVTLPAFAADVRAPNTQVLPADHPLPTIRNVDAARAVLEFVRSAPSDGLLLVLLSGGASAFLCLPAEGLALDELRDVTSAMQRGGASIFELNAVRKHVEQLKGGRLALHVPGLTEVLVVSDVEGDALDVIGSGPFAPDRSTAADAQAALARLGLSGRFPGIEQAIATAEETPKPGHPAFARVGHRVILSNRSVLDAVAEAARKQGRFVVREHRWIAGEAAEQGRTLMRSALEARARGRFCFLAGGEPVVNVGATTGTGGPSQELALAAAVELDESAQRGESVHGLAALAYSTDGADGPTELAGAAFGLGHGTPAARTALAAHDSTRYWQTQGGALAGGPSGTNVNHVFIAVGG